MSSTTFYHEYNVSDSEDQDISTRKGQEEIVFVTAGTAEEVPEDWEEEVYETRKEREYRELLEALAHEKEEDLG